MFNPHYEASAFTARVARSFVSKANLAAHEIACSCDFRKPASATAKVSGEECYASTEPVTWRHRQRLPRKNKTPITKAEAIAMVSRRRERYEALLDKHLAQEEAMAEDSPAHWDSDGLIEERIHARAMGE